MRKFKRRTDYRNVMQMEGLLISNPRYREMLDYIEPKCYVEASTTGQGGTVLKVIYNMYNLPVCVKVKHGSGRTDYISIDRIDFWEPFRECAPNLNIYQDEEDYAETLLANGYVWDEERGCYYNEETGDEDYGRFVYGY